MIAGLVPLVTDSVDQHRALVSGTAAEAWLATSDLAYAYDGRAAFDADAYGWESKRAAGFTPEMIDCPALSGKRDVGPIFF